MCDHHIADDPTGLACVRDHDDKGHVYASESAAPDAKRDADEEVDR